MNLEFSNQMSKSVQENEINTMVEIRDGCSHIFGIMRGNFILFPILCRTHLCQLTLGKRFLFLNFKMFYICNDIQIYEVYINILCIIYLINTFNNYQSEIQQNENIGNNKNFMNSSYQTHQTYPQSPNKLVTSNVFSFPFLLRFL